MKHPFLPPHTHASTYRVLLHAPNGRYREREGFEELLCESSRMLLQLMAEKGLMQETGLVEVAKLLQAPRLWPEKWQAIVEGTNADDAPQQQQEAERPRQEEDAKEGAGSCHVAEGGGERSSSESMSAPLIDFEEVGGGDDGNGHQGGDQERIAQDNGYEDQGMEDLGLNLDSSPSEATPSHYGYDGLLIARPGVMVGGGSQDDDDDKMTERSGDSQRWVTGGIRVFAQESP